MIRTLIALGLLLGLAGAALAAPPAVAPPGKQLVGQPQGPSPGPVGKERQPDSWTWFGMGFESRRARLGGEDAGPGAGEPWADGRYGGDGDGTASSTGGPTFGGSSPGGGSLGGGSTGGGSRTGPPAGGSSPGPSPGSPRSSFGSPASSFGGRAAGNAKGR